MKKGTGVPLPSIRRNRTVARSVSPLPFRSMFSHPRLMAVPATSLVGWIRVCFSSTASGPEPVFPRRRHPLDERGASAVSATVMDAVYGACQACEEPRADPKEKSSPGLNLSEGIPGGDQIWSWPMARVGRGSAIERVGGWRSSPNRGSQGEQCPRKAPGAEFPGGTGPVEERAVGLIQAKIPGFSALFDGRTTRPCNPHPKKKFNRHARP